MALCILVEGKTVALSQIRVEEQQPSLARIAETKIHLPAGVVGGTYKASIPLVRPSRLTSRQNGGGGKQLSGGGGGEFARGGSPRCEFFYVCAIPKRVWPATDGGGGF